MCFASVFIANIIADFIRLKGAFSLLYCVVLAGVAFYGDYCLLLSAIIALSFQVFLSQDLKTDNIYFLPTSRTCSVMSRYTFFLILNLMWLFCIIVINECYSFCGLESTKEFYYYILFFSFCLISLAIELPIIYYVGYTKSVVCRYINIIVYMAFVLAFKLFGSNLAHLLTAIVVVSILLYLISLFVSVKIYLFKAL